MAQKLWEKSVQVNKDIERFTVGRDREMDLYLAKHDVLGSMAHITMLESIGLLTKEELSLLLAELKNIYATAESGEFVIEEGVEDVHSQVELMLTRKLGDVGKKIHSGRSRNDQVLLDLKLFTRAEIRDIAEAVEQLFHVLVMQSERYKDVLMPGYTHLQIAMPSSFGLWFGAYAESLVDDMLFLQAAFKMCNRNPLGSAAGYSDDCNLTEDMKKQYLLAANYNSDTKEGKEKIEKIFVDNNSELIQNLEKNGLNIDGRSKISIMESSIGLATIITFIAIYLGIIFLIASSAILALKQLTDSSDNKQRYTILRKIGCDEKMINKALFRQIGIFFGVPLVLAIIHSVFGIQFAITIMSGLASKKDLLPSAIATVIIIGIIYGAYFLATYLGSRNIIKEE